MSNRDPYHKFMDRKLGDVQGDLALLDLVKGLEAYSSICERSVAMSFSEYPDPPEGLTEEEFEVWQSEREPLDALHHFARECRRTALGLRQQLEQRMFGGRRQ